MSEERVDHAAERSNADWARKNLTLANGQVESIRSRDADASPEELGLIHSQMATAHATLAAVEALRDIAHELEELNVRLTP